MNEQGGLIGKDDFVKSLIGIWCLLVVGTLNQLNRSHTYRIYSYSIRLYFRVTLLPTRKSVFLSLETKTS